MPQNSTPFKLIRFLGIPLFAFVFNALGVTICLSDDFGRQFVQRFGTMMYWDVLWSTILSVVCSELSLVLFNVLERRFSIEKRLATLITLHAVGSAVILISLTTAYGAIVYDFGSPAEAFIMKQNSLFMMFAALALSGLYVGMTLFQRWKQTMLQAEEFKRSSLIAQNEALKQQIDPHFLFNSLNTLTALIEKEPRVAVDFVQQLSGVYRYVLHSREREAVELASEIEFVQSYCFLLQMRFGENLRVRFDVPPDVQMARVPPLAVQLCVENAVKHNVVSRRNPLEILISTTSNTITVRNTLQRKYQAETSMHTGLQNIRHRYRLLTEQAVEIQETEHEFLVHLPLLPPLVQFVSTHNGNSRALTGELVL